MVIQDRRNDAKFTENGIAPSLLTNIRSVDWSNISSTTEVQREWLAQFIGKTGGEIDRYKQGRDGPVPQNAAANLQIIINGNTVDLGTATTPDDQIATVIIRELGTSNLPTTDAAVRTIVNSITGNLAQNKKDAIT